LRNPIRGTFGCCARAASGRAETQALDDRISEPYGVREPGGISLSGCHPNRVQATFAIAIDINPEANALKTKGSMPKFAIDAFKRQGARWGENYKKRKDPMHFEFVS